MPADHGDRLETIQGSQWTRQRVTYIIWLIDKEVRGWRDKRYRVVKLGVWNKTSEAGQKPNGGPLWFYQKGETGKGLRHMQAEPQN